MKQVGVDSNPSAGEMIMRIVAREVLDLQALKINYSPK
jgi:hypothetical protein